MLVFLKPAESLVQIILVMKLEACPRSLIDSHTAFPLAELGQWHVGKRAMLS